MKKSVKELVASANSEIKTYQVDEAMAMLNKDNVQFIDVRDDKELENEGMIPGAIHASRGMLEFYIDPQTPYHKDVFSPDAGKELIFYCKSGGRSALAAQRAREMGLDNVAHLATGFTGWKEKGGPVEKPMEKVL